MKLLPLHNKLKIERETDKAVAVAPKELTEKQLKDVEFLFWATNTKVKKSLFWLPKSQILIEGGEVVAVSSWIEQQNFVFFDSPLFLERDYLEAQNLKKEAKSICGN